MKIPTQSANEKMSTSSLAEKLASFKLKPVPTPINRDTDKNNIPFRKIQNH